MKYLFAFAAALLLSLHVPPALAAWSPVANVGNTQFSTSNPSCATLGNNDAVCAMGNSSHRLVVNRYTAGVWSGWTVINTVISSDPSCASRGAGQAVCVARGAATNLVYSIFNGAAWSLPATIPGSNAYSAPSCATISATQVACAARSVTGGFTATILNGAVWGAFANLPTATVFAPGCAGDGFGQVYCANVSTTGNVLATRWVAGAWQAVVNITGQASDPVTCSGIGTAGQIVCYTRGTNVQAFGNRFVGPAWIPAGWQGWASLSGILQSTMTCVSAAVGKQTCATIALTDGAIYFLEFNGASWGSWTKIGGALIGNPACAAIAANKTLCVSTGIDNRLKFTAGP
jgi:hypothetical protein